MSYNWEELLEHFNKDNILGTEMRPRNRAQRQVLPRAACARLGPGASAAWLITVPGSRSLHFSATETGALSTPGVPRGHQPREPPRRQRGGPAQGLLTKKGTF